jgi:hypothetical protein
MNDVYGTIFDDPPVIRLCLFNSQRVRRGPHGFGATSTDDANLRHAQPTDSFHMYAPNETCSDNGGS